MTAPDRIVAALATRQGTGVNNADAGAVFTTSGGTTGAAVIDIIGHQPTATGVAHLLAETAARVAAQRGGPAGLLSAGLLVADPGDGDPEPDGVGVVAVRHPEGDTDISWLGDCHAYGWDGIRLHRYTTPHTYGQQLRANGAPWHIAEQHDNWVLTALSKATPAGIFTVTTFDPLILLCSDGIDTLTHDQLTALVDQHSNDPRALADALTAAVPNGPDGYRDDTTVIALTTLPGYDTAA